MKKIKTLLILNLIAFSSFANVSYTPQQLNEMVNSGNYPEQENMTSTTKTASFTNCKIMIESIMSQIRDYYPVKEVLNNSIVYSVKAWTNDAGMTVTCTALDSKMVITQSNYV